MKNIYIPGSLFSIRVTNMFVWITILIFVLIAFLNSFIQDDAFISFRYALNLIQEHELTWNPGEEQRVEGYTNFLWTLMMSIPIALNIDPVVASKLFGLLFAAGTLYFAYRLSLLLLQCRFHAFLTLILIGSNYTFIAYATGGGLETPMQSFMIAASTYLAFLIVENNKWKFKFLLALSFLCSAALLTRLDSAIPFTILFAFILWNLIKRSVSVKNLVIDAAYLVFPTLFIVGFWLLWKYVYYGDILPNTYYAKATYFSLGVLGRGIAYIYGFLQSYILIPFIFLSSVFIKDILSQPKKRILLAVTTLWCIYVVKVGGDFMEFRLLVPVLTLFFVLVVSIIYSLNCKRAKVALVAMILFGSFHHYITFRGLYGIESISQLNGHIVNKNENWDKVGLILKELFLESEEPVVIATGAAGAIPYYSQLPTIDMLGMNDKWIARNGVIVSTVPGHQRRATLEYLVKRGVNLVIGHPWVEPIFTAKKTEYPVDILKRFLICNIEADLIPYTSKVVEIPLDSEYKVTVLYLCQHDHIDRVIRELNLRKYNILK